MRKAILSEIDKSLKREVRRERLRYQQEDVDVNEISYALHARTFRAR